MNRLIIFVLISLCLAFPAFAQEAGKGKMAGTVIDARTQEALAGVNVELKGTYMGAATDLDGQFLITNVSPGQYDVEVSIIGYKIYLKTGFEVGPGETKIIEVELEESILAFGEEIEVVGKKPLLEVDLTSSEESFSSTDIEQKIVESLDDIVSQQAGVVKTDGEIHIRGGRADESMYIIDGVSVKDPLSGFGNTVYVNPDAIKELKVITGGFNAEYGQAMSGVIDVVTKEGDDTFSGSLKLKSDHLGIGAFSNANTQILEFNLGGPELITNYILPVLGINLPGQLSFFISGYGNITDTYLNQASQLYPSRSSLDMFAPRQENIWHILGKLTWMINPGQKISLSYDRSLGINQGFFTRYLNQSAYYPYAYSQNLDNYPTYTTEAILVNLIWKHTVSQRTFYEVTVSDFYNSTHSAVQNKHWSDYSQNLDLYPIRYISDSQGNVTIRRGDGFYDHGDYNKWYDNYSDRWSVKSEITSQITTDQQFKAGFELAYTEMQVVDIVDPWVDSDIGFGSSYDIYKAHSYLGNFYIQDQIKYGGMIVNIGLRYDYWFPGKFVQDAIDDPETVIISDEARQLFYEETFEVFGLRGKGQISPRIGISHPVSDRDVLYFHYGHFAQFPRGQNVYAKLKATSPATYQQFGNPNLNPQTTVAYELGLKHKFNENLVMDLRVYYKDQFDYPTLERVEMENPRLGSISYYMYFNADYSRSKGVELRIKQRYAKYLTGTLNFTYAVNKGKSSHPNDNLLVAAGQLEEKPLKENYLAWDKPIRLTLDLNFHVGDDLITLFGLPLPDKWGASLRWELISGKRYTYFDVVTEISDDANPYAKLADYWQQLDLRLYKYVDLFGLDLSLIVLMENILDAKIPRIINPNTGEEYKPDDPLPSQYTREINPTPDPIYNPSKYRWPRRLTFGLSIRF